LFLQPQGQSGAHEQQWQQVDSSQAHLSSGFSSGMPHFLHFCSSIFLFLI